MAIRKQQILLEKIVENNSKPASEQKSLRQVILDAGYSESEANNPGEILKRRSWEELIEDKLPDDLVADALNKSLNATGGHVRNQAADIVIKIKGRYAPQKIQVSNEDELSDEELEKRILEKKKQIEEQEKSKKEEKTSEKDPELKDTQG